MGDRADALKLSLHADLNAMDATSRDLAAAADDVIATARSLSGVKDKLGMGGLSGDAASARIASIAGDIKGLAQYLDGLQAVADESQRAIIAAQRSYRDLPDGEMSWAERAAFTAGGAVVMGPAGAVGGTLAANTLSDRREQAREREASRALRSLESGLGAITMPRISRGGIDPIPQPPVPEPPTPQGGSTSTRTRSGDWNVRGTTPTGGGVTSVPASPAVAPTSPGWQPPVSSGIDTGLGGGSGSGSAGPGSGSGVGVGIGSGPGSGSDGGTIGGTVPGRGDGSSSDGAVGGTVPGGNGSGGGFLGGSGGPGGAGAGSGSLGGVGAGGMAGGLAVGGAALGAAGLSRLVGGGAGAGGFGGAGAAGGGSFGGGTFAAGGGHGAGAAGTQRGAAGSGLSGSTSALGQGSQTGAASGAASGTRSGSGMMGGPMGGGGGAGASKDAKRRASGGLLAPNIDVEEGAERPDLGAGAGAGRRDALNAPVVTADAADDEW
ncbi:hypothetical protein [Cellulomonas triticagri]|uniref:Uncharacterized protein n=1 Tax=Cellulomonas triticagri TaxID=2483352 RepID=A0A3M2JHN1_9CELL|nr:hypothetical protein [Cellulomonas triticagri]RMI13547.1 hypothetical protein EBM89_03810 [Cellulomonas triticagri]